jgi:hypothetical protein
MKFQHALCSYVRQDRDATAVLAVVLGNLHRGGGALSDDPSLPLRNKSHDVGDNFPNSSGGVHAAEAVRWNVRCAQ